MAEFTIEEDGKLLTSGVVISTKYGVCDAVYRCDCGREQSASYPGFNRGISESSAERCGWRKMDSKWICPFCTGNTENLRQAFIR